MTSDEKEVILEAINTLRMLRTTGVALSHWAIMIMIEARLSKLFPESSVVNAEYRDVPLSDWSWNGRLGSVTDEPTPPDYEEVGWPTKLLSRYK